MKVNGSWAVGVAVCWLVSLSGCSDARSRIVVPSMDPAAAGADALAMYDADHDGALKGAELDRCPGIKAGLRLIDVDQDGRVTGEEIAARLKKYQTDKIGLVQLLGNVTLDGRPLRAAVVTLVPEKFMGSAVKPAQGKTDEGGNFHPVTEGVDANGVRCGIYRIEVSAKDAGGTETVPSRFNSETLLGVEVGAGSPVIVNGIELSLSSR